MRSFCWRFVQIGAILLAAIGAAAADETFIPKLQLGTEDFNIRFYGQFDPALLVADDGRKTLGYGPVNNNNDSTEMGLLLFARLSDALTFGANVKGEYDPYSTDYVNQTNRGDPDWGRLSLSTGEAYFTSTQYGKLWLGYGDMASDSSTGIDLSGTTVAATSSVADLAGGQLFRFSGHKGLSTIDVSSAFDDLDGAGSKVRVRYDTPGLAGFTLSTSFGRDLIPRPNGKDTWDIALRYAGEFGALRVQSAVAYARTKLGDNRYSGSASTLHVPTGISLTAAAGYNEGEDGLDSRYIYGKLGYQKRFFPQGITAFSVDVYSGDDISVVGSQSFSWGAQIVQNFDYYQAQAYVGFRSYEYDDRTASYDRLLAVLTGVLIEF